MLPKQSKPLELKGVRIGPVGLPKLTLGWQALAWTAEYLLQPDGPDAGKPWVFTPEQVRFLLWWYAIDEQGRFIYRRGMLRRMKGWGKDPFGAAICCIEFVGPCRFSHFNEKGEPVAMPHSAAWIQTAAVSRDQTRNTMTLFPGMLSPLAIATYRIDLGKEIIYSHRGRRRIEAVTSSPRAVEGQRATFVLKNETHLWFEVNEGHAMSSVIARNAAKSRDGSSRVMAISNAHNPGEDSDAERDYVSWLQYQSGQARKTGGFLYDSLEAPPETDLYNEDSLRAGLRAARGDSDWLDIDRLVEEIYDPTTPPSTSRRFYLNQIVAQEDAWLSPQEWERCGDKDKVVEPGELIAMGFDGSKTQDHSALVGCRISDGHLFTLGVWVPPKDREIDRDLIDARVEKAFVDYDVVAFYSDVHPWESYIDKWEATHADTLCAQVSTRHPIAWDMRGKQRETTWAVESFLDAVLERQLTHENDPVTNQYVYNARRRPNNYGVTIGKEFANSSRKIDWAVAAVLARRARQDYLALPESKKRKPPSRGISIATV